MSGSNQSQTRGGQKIKAVIILIIAFIFAYFAFLGSAENYFLSVGPRLAPPPLSDNPRMVVKSLDTLSSVPGVDVPSEKQVRRLAAISLLDRPLDPLSVRLLGGYPGFSMERVASREILLLSERLSRRDTYTQLSLVVDSAKDNNVQKAVEHMDRILTVRRAVLPEILPQLIGISEFQEGRKLLVKRANRPWFNDFVETAIYSDVDPLIVASLVSDLGKDDVDDSNVRIHRDVLGHLAGKLARLGHYERGAAIAVLAGNDISSMEEFVPNANNTDQTFAPLNWSFADDTDGFASISDDGWVEVSIEAGKKIVAMHRVAMAPANSQTLLIRTRDHTGLSGLMAVRSLCRFGERWTTEWDSGWHEISRDVDQVKLTVGKAGCSAPLWQVYIQSSDGQLRSTFDMKLKLVS